MKVDLIGTNNGVMKFTKEGGLAVLIVNKTGAATVKGTLVEPSPSTASAFAVSGTSAFDPIGVVYDSGIDDGQKAWMVILGIADVLMQDDNGVSLEDFMQGSVTQAGRAYSPGSIPDGQSFAAVNNHFREIGHSLQAIEAGTNKLCRILMHFN